MGTLKAIASKIRRAAVIAQVQAAIAAATRAQSASKLLAAEVKS